MKHLVLAVALFLSGSLYAAQAVRMNMVLSLNGERVMSPQVITRLKETASITQGQENSADGYTIEVTPSLSSGNSKEILMNFRIGKKENGKTKWISAPSILALDNHESEISQKSNGTEMSLKVTPTLQ